MYVNYVRVVIRRRDDFTNDEIDEADSFTVYPADDGVDASGITDDVRGWLLDGQHPRFLFEERRQYADVGAAGSSVTYVLDLLASGAVGYLMTEVAEYMKGKLGDSAENNAAAERFADASTDELINDALGEAERALELGRGDFEAEEVERRAFELELRARRRSTGTRYRVVKNADGTIAIRKLKA